ncbi:transporter [Streptomyces sanyensis]|uniref:transporter n=1 Tax=Streptomyces sanyensis TaxID=568869 RepID=UPI003D777D91
MPLLVLLVWTGVTAGSLLVGPARRLGPRALGALLAAGALATAAGALWGRPAGFVGVAAGFLVFQLVDVVADARLQAAVSGPGRATITSLAGLGKEAATLGVFGAYAALSSQVDHGPVFALLVVPYLLVALVLGARPRGAGGAPVPPARTGRPPGARPPRSPAARAGRPEPRPGGTGCGPGGAAPGLLRPGPPRPGRGRGRAGRLPGRGAAGAAAGSGRFPSPGGGWLG